MSGRATDPEPAERQTIVYDEGWSQRGNMWVVALIYLGRDEEGCETYTMLRHQGLGMCFSYN